MLLPNILKKLNRHSYSFLSNKLSSKSFPHNLSKDIIVCLSFSICSLYFLYFYCDHLKNYFFLIDNPHAIPVDIGITIKPIPVKLNVKWLDIVAIITNVWNDFNIVDNVLYFLYFFLIYGFYLWRKWSFL